MQTQRSRYWRVTMASRPAVGRTFYDGKVDVYAASAEEAESSRSGARRACTATATGR